MQNFPEFLNEAKAQGVEVIRVCTFCPTVATGDLTVDDGEGNDLRVPICEACVESLQKKYAEKFDTRN